MILPAARKLFLLTSARGAKPGCHDPIPTIGAVSDPPPTWGLNTHAGVIRHRQRGAAYFGVGMKCPLGRLPSVYAVEVLSPAREVKIGT